jgi:hypothetical protein
MHESNSSLEPQMTKSRRFLATQIRSKKVVEKYFSIPFPSFPRRRESRLFRLLLDPRFHGDDELDCDRYLFQQAIDASSIE